MPFPKERFLLLPIGEGPTPWDSANVTASSEVAGGEGVNVLTARHDRGWYFDFSTERTLTFDLGSAPPDINFVFLGGLEISGTGLGPEHVQIRWDSDDEPSFTDPTAWGPKPYAIRATGLPAARLNMPQANLGLSDAELPAVMAQGRLHSHFKAPEFPTALQHRYHRLTISHTAPPNADQRAYLPIIQGGWGWQPDGAQWAPGGLSRRFAQRSNGETLRGWNFNCQAVLEDVLHLKLLEWFAANGNRNRAVFWSDPDRPQRFIQNCAMVQVLELSAADVPGAFQSVTVTGAEQSESYVVSFNLIERFNDETET